MLAGSSYHTMTTLFRWNLIQAIPYFRDEHVTGFKFCNEELWKNGAQFEFSYAAMSAKRYDYLEWNAI